MTYHASGNLDNCTLINNTATKYGGAVAIMLNYLDYMDLNITNSVFKGNKAPLGGAVKLDGLNIKIEKLMDNSSLQGAIITLPSLVIMFLIVIILKYIKDDILKFKVGS